VADPGYACCTFRGSVVALDAQSGRTLWKTYLVSEEPHPLKLQETVSGFGPAGVPVLAAPTIDGEHGFIYLVTGRAYGSVDQPLANAVVALDLKDGAVRWAKQPGPRSGNAGEFTASAVLRTAALGRRVLIAAQRSGAVYALDPDRAGELVWQAQLAPGKGSVEWGIGADHHALYVPLTVTRESQDAGSLVALDLKSGQPRWQVEAPHEPCAWGAEGCSHGLAQAVTVIPGAAFCGDLDGHLRAYSTIDGKVLWDVQTARDFTTLNGFIAHGGSLDEGGATVVNGVLYVNSGSGRYGGHAGNVLLAYSLDGK
jgi:polyvinyl alcohol dehydrogenase (cytochrome)